MWRAKLKEDPHRYENYKVNERYRKLKKSSNANSNSATDLVVESESASEGSGSSTDQNDLTSSNSPSSFSTKQSLHRSLSRVSNFLPKSPHKKTEVIEKLAEKYKVKFNFKKSTRGRPRKDLKEEEKNWLIEFLARGDLTYTNPGRKDNVYIGKQDGERIYKQRLYLLWNLRDILEIANGTGKIEIANSFNQTFDKLLRFSQLYDFLKAHKEYSYNKNIPHGSCLCEICENCVLLAKGLNKKLEEPLPTDPHDLVEKFACDLNIKKCALNECESCSYENFDFGSKKDHSNSDSFESVEEAGDDDEDEVKYLSWKKIEKRITKATLAVTFEDAVVAMKEQVKVLKEHIYVKRVQNEAYNYHKDGLKNNDLIVHVDFAENYRNDQQNEIQSAYFGHQSFSLFTSCCYFKDDKNIVQQKSIVIVTESSDHNRVTSMSSLKKVVEIAEKSLEKSFGRLIVWSDGMSAQFRSRFVFKLLADTLFFGKQISWFYNERHHGKGPMDGVGGTLKNVIFRKVKSGQTIINTPEDFAKVAVKFVPSITTVYLPKEAEIVEPADIDNAPLIKDTLQVHKLERYLNKRNEVSIKFFKTAADEEPFYTQWYSKVNGLICGHKESNAHENQCAECHKLYCEDGTEWLECPMCKKWFHETCFYV